MADLRGLHEIVKSIGTLHDIEEYDPPYFQGASPFWRTAVENATAPAPVWPDVLIQAWIDITWEQHVLTHQPRWSFAVVPPALGPRRPPLADG